jgi:hypothetical protein
MCSCIELPLVAGAFVVGVEPLVEEHLIDGEPLRAQ